MSTLTLAFDVPGLPAGAFCSLVRVLGPANADCTPFETVATPQILGAELPAIRNGLLAAWRKANPTWLPRAGRPELHGTT